MSAHAPASPFAGAKRLVIKTGSALMVDEDGAIRGAWLAGLASDLAALKARKLELAVVTSGAVAIGRWKLGFGKRALKIEEKQAAAAAGQIWLAHAWA
ncbi:MAG: glutamate 5-kinase, partial [Tagaea sp.]|nr:glutamate 5-kinase [Tagaea sp.]